MKKIVIYVLIVASLVALCLFGVLAYVHSSASDYMAKAASAYRAGDIKSARKLLLAEIKRDPTNEDAFKMLASIDEKMATILVPRIFTRI